MEHEWPVHAPRYENTVLAEQLQAAKGEMHEMSEASGVLTIHGELRAGTDPALWTGASSLHNRLESGEITEEEVNRELQRANSCYVAVTKGAPKRCVEDRTVEGFNDDDATNYAAQLGPQFQGGTPDEAVAYRLAHSPDAADADFIADIKTVAESKESDFAPGAHTGANQTAEKTDCGSVDNEDTKLDVTIDQAAAPVVQELTGLLMSLRGKPMTAELFQQFQRSVRALRANHAYFARKAQAQDAVRAESPQGVPHVVGDHNQIGIIFNMVHGTTFHTSHFNAENGGKMTVHNLDAWNIFDENAEPEQVALFAMAVVTVMKITDGSLRWAVRTPKEAAAAIA